MVELAVIGGGPAGLRVAELAARAGFAVNLYDQKRSVGRKFLIAGKSGLNLTNARGQICLFFYKKLKKTIHLKLI